MIFLTKKKSYFWQVEVNIGDRKDKLDVTANPDESIGDTVSCLGHYIEFVISEVI